MTSCNSIRTNFMNRNINNFLKKDSIGEPPWDYYFLENLDEAEYPRYLAKLFYLNTGEKLPLKHGVIDKNRCKTFNQKIQWIKLYGVTDLMRKCTDKVSVRNYVKERIGEEYLKPVLQVIPESNETMHCHCEQVHDNLGLAKQSTGNNNNTMDCRVAQNDVAPRNDRALCALPPDLMNKNDVSTYFLKSALQIIPNESQDTMTMHCHCEQTNDHLMSAWQSNEKSEHTINKMPQSSRNYGKIEDVSTYFDKINWDKLPDRFVIKCNHGCKWQYIIKDKKLFLQNKRLRNFRRVLCRQKGNPKLRFWRGKPDSILGAQTRSNKKSAESKDFNGGNSKIFELVKQQITGWLEQNYSFWGGFEMQYQNIKPKILIEPLMREDINTAPREIEVYCFNGEPKIFVNVRYGAKRVISYYDENFNQIDLILHPDGKNIIKNEKADCLTKQTFDLSAKLCITNPSPHPSTQYNRCISFTQLEPSLVQLYPSRGEGVLFNFVRIDWLVFNNKLYFNELTFTPYSGFMRFDKKWNLKLGSWINL